ncbi:hypothetical protein PR202_ga26697 [Eleusine coracana subsp. coracana]|uniref:GH10 domain-containing protein n=1 Tax=Eleusine coracana subsp. coracana TaxID=191504 RepID=A0AAV5DCK4_ELECO|nr:hypothetical protein PR202_ga26697 [Eleusine coracana subsp. coracana]
MERAWLFLLLWVAVLLSAARVVQSLPYDYSSSSECLPEPLEAHYGGGIIRNSDFSAGLKGWSSFGYGVIAEGSSASGNVFAVAVNRTRPYQSVSQKVYLQNDTHYTLSGERGRIFAEMKVSDGSADVIAVVKTNGEFIHAGGVDARSGCWTILKGGLTAAAAGPAELYFESNATVDVWVDNVSLQPFSQEEWSAHHDASIKKSRKKTVRFHAKDSAGNPVPGAQVRIEHVRNGFPLGSAMSGEILSNPAYQRWFTSRFTVTTFENEMKWYSTERVQGREDYSVPDAMMRFAKSHGISVRGHNVFWDDPNSQPAWAKWLSGDQLKRATAKRISFYENKLGSEAEASAAFYRKAHEMDNVANMFMNDYNTLEQPGDYNAIPKQVPR